MSVKVRTRIGKVGIAEGNPQKGLMEYGYGLYVNAFVYDTDFVCEEVDDDGCLGMYATVRVPFDADQATISRARKRAGDRARQRYRRERIALGFLP